MTSLAIAPSTVYPALRTSLHNVSLPVVQYSQLPHAAYIHAIDTRSPTFNESTLSATSMTRPIPSCPSVTPVTSPKSAFLTCKSV